ncbi:MAG: hypothetical protein ACI9WU_003982 [Myxococcota bacterium]|jgi:hypothetical protein
MELAIDSACIPQQDDLGKVRDLVAAMHRGVPRAELGDVVGLSSRHVRYTLHAARALGLTVQDGKAWNITPTVADLLGVEAASDSEKQVLRRLVSDSPALMAVVPELFTDSSLELETLGERLMEKAGFSGSTAMRRAMTLLAWRDALQPVEVKIAAPVMPQPVIEEEEEEIEELVMVPEPGYERDFDSEGQILMF